MWIFTTLPGFIGVTPELTLLPSTPWKTGSDPPSASSAPPNRRSRSRAIGGPPSSAPGCPLQHLSKQTRPLGAEDTVSHHRELSTPESLSTSTSVISSPAPGRSWSLWLGWTWDLHGLSSLPTSPPRDPPPTMPRRPPPGVWAPPSPEKPAWAQLLSRPRELRAPAWTRESIAQRLGAAGTRPGPTAPGQLPPSCVS